MENQAKEISKYDINEIRDKVSKSVEEFGKKECTFKPLDPNKRIITPEDLKDSGIISEEFYDFVKMLTTPIPMQTFDIYVEPPKKEKE